MILNWRPRTSQLIQATGRMNCLSVVKQNDSERNFFEVKRPADPWSQALLICITTDGQWQLELPITLAEEAGSEQNDI